MMSGVLRNYFQGGWIEVPVIARLEFMRFFSTSHRYRSFHLSELM